MFRALVLAFSCTFAVGAAPALAQSAKSQAKAFFKQGREHYAAGRFAEALQAFEQANALRPHPLMLYNIGQVQEAMEDLPAALATFKKYLATSPGDADEVNEKIAGIEAQLAKWATLVLSTTPPGATVWVGDRKHPPRGRTPLSLPLPAGRQTLILELAGHRTVKRPVDVKAKTRVKLGVAMPPILPTVLVRTNPPGARMFFDNRPAAVPSPATQGLPAGKHVLRLELDGHDPVTREFTLTAAHTIAKPFVVDVVLQKAVPKGFLALTVEGPTAEVRIDGELKGTTPLKGPLQLPQGLHKLTLTGEGIEPYEEMVTIAAGETVSTEVELEAAGGGGGGIDIDTGTVGWILVGVGGAALAGSAVTAALAFGADGDLQDCRDDSACAGQSEEKSLADDVRTNALVTDILIGTGVAIAATGAALLLFADEPPAAAETDGQVFVAPTAEGGVMAGARWGF